MRRGTRLAARRSTRCRVLGLFALAATLSAAQPAPAVVWRTVGVGVEHAQFVRTSDASGAAIGPWNVNVLRIDLSRARLDVVHAMDEAVGLETVSSIARRHGAVAAVNGGYFRTAGRFAGTRRARFKSTACS